MFRPFLADGAIVAMHDVLHSQGGPTRVFAEDVLLSPHFGAFGFSGSIGWAQYFIDPEVSIPFRVRKLGTYRRLANLVALSGFGGDLHGWKKIRYKIARAGIPHGDVQPAGFRSQAALVA